MDDTLPPPLIPPVYKDRRTGLIVFGIFTILIGAVCALFVPFLFVGQFMTPRQAGGEMNWSATLISAGVYALLAIAFIWLGVGSILARRWARALLLCLGWIGLITGLIAMPMVFIAMNSIGETLEAQGQTVPPGTLAVIKFFAVATTFVIYIVIPGIAVLFYRSPHVKQTCEVRDPVERWTDRCPLPVLAVVLLKAFWAVSLLMVIPLYGNAFPLLGYVVTGAPAYFLWLMLILFLAYTAWGFYRLDQQAWRVYLIGAIALGISTLVTFQRVGVLEYYRKAGMSQVQLDLMANNPLLVSGSLLWLSAFGALVYLGYVFYLRRYFTRS